MVLPVEHACAYGAHILRRSAAIVSPCSLSACPLLLLVACPSVQCVALSPLDAQVDPFDPKSPIKQCAIVSFPPDLFFVLRVVQLLRGMASGACGYVWQSA
jgi:hypothetical protein